MSERGGAEQSKVIEACNGEERAHPLAVLPPEGPPERLALSVELLRLRASAGVQGPGLSEHPWHAGESVPSSVVPLLLCCPLPLAPHILLSTAPVFVSFPSTPPCRVIPSLRPSL